MELKNYDEAEKIYLEADKRIREIYGEKSIFRGRINSCMIEINAARGEK